MKGLLRRLIDGVASRIASATARAVFRQPFPDSETALLAIETEREFQRLREAAARKTPGCPIVDGFAAYSQCDEDGILQNILQRIAGTGHPIDQTCIEIGCGSGIENNTHYLLLNGFRAVWIDGNPDEITRCGAALGCLRFNDLWIRQSFVTLENIGALMQEASDFLKVGIDVLSIDIDGNDLDLALAAARDVRPKVLIGEYNPRFPPPARIRMPYDPAHRWSADDFSGASLMCWVDELAADYQLVSCNLSGVNAFFVRRDLAGAFPEFSPADLYQPLRRHICLLQKTEHPRSMKFLRRRLT